MTVIEGTGRPRWWLQSTTRSTNYLLTPNLQVYRLQRWNFWISTQSLKKHSKALPAVDLTEFLSFSSIVGQVRFEIFKWVQLWLQGGRRYEGDEGKADSYGGFER